MVMLALAIAIVLTAIITIVTFTDDHTIRAIKLTIIGVVIAVIVLALECARVRINFTGSMPFGVYTLAPLQHENIERDMLVAVCAPGRAATLGLRRGYLARGPCGSGTELLLKSVAAVAGDKVDVTVAGVAVNGCLLPHSQALSRDSAGRRLLRWPERHLRLRPDQLWLYAGNDRSWDSRYWGTASVGDIAAEAVPFLVLPSILHAASGHPGCRATESPTPEPSAG